MIDQQQSGLNMVAFVAERLGDLRERVMFVGGAVTGLLVTDPSVRAIRPTDDVDVVVEVATYSKYAQVGEELRQLGFHESAVPGDPICRWSIEGMVVDVMPTKEDILGFNNRWYSAAVQSATTYLLKPGPEIRLISAPYFVATKLDAFQDRGKGDYTGSRDMEDIISVVDGRVELAAEIAASPADLGEYLAVTFRNLLADADFVDALSGHLYPDPASQARVTLIERRMRDIAQRRSL